MRAVRQLRKELGTEHGTIKRVAEQLGTGVESLRGWVKQAEIDAGVKPGVTTAIGRMITPENAATWAPWSARIPHDPLPMGL